MRSMKSAETECWFAAWGLVFEADWWLWFRGFADQSKAIAMKEKTGLNWFRLMRGRLHVMNQQKRRFNFLSYDVGCWFSGEGWTGWCFSEVKVSIRQTVLKKDLLYLPQLKDLAMCDSRRMNLMKHSLFLSLRSGLEVTHHNYNYPSKNMYHNWLSPKGYITSHLQPRRFFRHRLSLSIKLPRTSNAT